MMGRNKKKKAEATAEKPKEELHFRDPMIPSKRYGVDVSRIAPRISVEVEREQDTAMIRAINDILLKEAQRMAATELTPEMLRDAINYLRGDGGKNVPPPGYAPMSMPPLPGSGLNPAQFGPPIAAGMGNTIQFEKMTRTTAPPLPTNLPPLAAASPDGNAIVPVPADLVPDECREGGCICLFNARHIAQSNNIEIIIAHNKAVRVHKVGVTAETQRETLQNQIKWYLTSELVKAHEVEGIAAYAADYEEGELDWY